MLGWKTSPSSSEARTGGCGGGGGGRGEMALKKWKVVWAHTRLCRKKTFCFTFGLLSLMNLCPWFLLLFFLPFLFLGGKRPRGISLTTKDFFDNKLMWYIGKSKVFANFKTHLFLLAFLEWPLPYTRVSAVLLSRLWDLWKFERFSPAIYFTYRVRRGSL